ncbi:MAG: YeiH family protein [Rhodocyclaceae bacterium]|nr:YeiH family protein [Rhodocyclaceae bacterium]
MLDPIFGNWGKAAEPTLGWNFARIFNLNYVVLGIVIGIVIVNLLRIPAWAANGVRTARFFLKTGVILLGTLYSAAELVQLGILSVVLIGVFVLGSVGLVLVIGPRINATNSMTGVLSAGVGVCGVSASVAAAPVVQAKAVDIAYTIGTILLWGVLCMFIFPTIGHLLNMGPVQFGAWAGTGILNSAQVAGAALAFDPKGIETLKVAEIFNITRVLFLPIIVVWLAAWYVKREVGAEKVDLGKVLVAKFPVFVIGFILMFAASSAGLFAPAGHYQGKYFSSTEIKEDKLLRGEGRGRPAAGPAAGAERGREEGARGPDRQQEGHDARARQHPAQRGQDRRHGQGRPGCTQRRAQGGLARLESHRRLPRLDRLAFRHRPHRPGHADHRQVAQAGGRQAARHRLGGRAHQGPRLARRRAAVRA